VIQISLVTKETVQVGREVTESIINVTDTWNQVNLIIPVMKVIFAGREATEGTISIIGGHIMQR
jgi:hypothetical protein